MKILQQLSKCSCDQVLAFNVPECGLKGFLVIDSTYSGITFGGIRLRKYKNEEEAFNDAVSLARAMTNKCKISGVAGGGGKIVLIDTPKLDREPALAKLAEIINEFGGTFYTGRDFGTTQADIALLRKKTKFVLDERESSSGDLAKWTAYGVLKSMEAMTKFVYGKASLKGLTVLVQGLGDTGEHLVGFCNKAGAKLILADIKHAKAKQLAARFRCGCVMANKVYETPCDIFAPCAVGQVLNKETIKKLDCKIVAGSANNVFEDPMKNDMQLFRRKIVTVPDYLMNAGALIQGANFVLSKKKNNKSAIEHIGKQTTKILQLTRLKKMPPLKVAQQFIQGSQ